MTRMPPIGDKAGTRWLVYVSAPTGRVWFRELATSEDSQGWDVLSGGYAVRAGYRRAVEVARERLLALGRLHGAEGGMLSLAAEYAEGHGAR